jgi:hypothetical protein
LQELLDQQQHGRLPLTRSMALSSERLQRDPLLHCIIQLMASVTKQDAMEKRLSGGKR